MRVDADRVGSLPAREERAELRADRRSAGVGRIDVQPDAGRLARVGDRGNRVDRRRAGRPDRRRAPRTRRRGRAGRCAAGSRRRPGPCGARAPAASPPCRRRSARARSDDDPASGRARAPRPVRRAPGGGGVLDVTVEPGRKPDELSQPVGRHLLELLERGRRAPENPGLVEPGDQQLRQNAGLRAVVAK